MVTDSVMQQARASTVFDIEDQVQRAQPEHERNGSNTFLSNIAFNRTNPTTLGRGVTAK
jgi:hypothetical protein